MVKRFSGLALALLAFSILAIGQAAKEKKTSPFLGDISGFKQSKERKTMLVDRHPTKKAVHYQKLMFEPVVILQSERSKHEQLSEEDKKVFSTYLQKMQTATFRDVADIVEQPAEGVLQVRTAIRGLQRGNYYMDAGGTKQIKPDSKVPVGTFEMEAIDSMTNERIVALVDEVGKENLSKAEKEEMLPTVEKLFTNWIEMLKKTFQQEKILSSIPK